jgi:hypothetical protein
MDSLFNAADNNSIQERINKLIPDAKPLWGKMNVSQMLAHLQPAMVIRFGKLQLKGTGLIGQIVKHPPENQFICLFIFNF